MEIFKNQMYLYKEKNSDIWDMDSSKLKEPIHMEVTLPNLTQCILDMLKGHPDAKRWKLKRLRKPDLMVIVKRIFDKANENEIESSKNNCDRFFN